MAALKVNEVSVNYFVGVLDRDSGRFDREGPFRTEEAAKAEYGRLRQVGLLPTELLVTQVTVKRLA